MTTVAELEKGPEESGVFARIDGGELELLGSDGEVERRAPAGTGLVAASAPGEEDTVWAVTGLDERGVEAAAWRSTGARCATPTRWRSPGSGGEAAVSLVPVYTPRPTPLHEARASVGAGFCCAFALVGRCSHSRWCW